MSYAWIIDKDHLADDDTSHDGTWPRNDAGKVGPHDAPDLFVEVLQGSMKLYDPGDVRIYPFKMFDDDGELYYDGRMITDEGKTERACYGPLADFGGPNAGCTTIRYPGHPEMDC